MKKIAKFEKVSLEQFLKDSGTASDYNQIIMPSRATAGSAGYDIYLPAGIRLEPGKSIRIATGLRVRIEEGWVLFILPKSGLGTKFRFQLDNTCGVIDSDYYNAENEGHILITMINDSREGKILELPAGKAFAQAIFLPYGITTDDEAEGIRTGGFGSTGV